MADSPIVLRAYVPAGIAVQKCTCMGAPVVNGTPEKVTVLGWLHDTHCVLTEGLLQAEAEAGAL